MDNIFSILKDLGYEVCNDLQEYYKRIDLWRYYWKGYDPKFHEYTTTNVRKQPLKIKRKSMKMAKKVAEDWASLLLNDKTYVKLGDKEEKSQIFLTGDEVEQQGGVFGLSKFWKQGNRTVEKSYALGTAIFYLDLVSSSVVNGKLNADNVKIKYIKDPKQFIPLGWENDEITECAIYSYKAIKGKQYIYLQIITLEREGYKISNKYYLKNDSDYQESELPKGMAEWYVLPCKPFFVITPNAENSFIDDIPVGASVYAGAIDCLQLCDIAFDNFYTDFYLGRKKIFMDQDLFATEKVAVERNGKKEIVEMPLVGESLEQSLYASTGKVSPGDKKMFEEYNPTLRVNENKDGIQFALDLLSSKVGFGQNKYQFQMQSMSTATQVRVSNKDQTESIWKQRIQINEILTDLVHSILVLGKEICHLDVNPDAKITIKFDDTMFTDEEAERMKDLNDVNAGLMAKWEYRVKWYGEDEDSAKMMVDEINGSAPGLTFGDE
nr:MAG TPA: portal protein [Caudoviricetes sp.]